MSMGLTLFGGLAAVVALFGLARVFRLPAEIAGLLAGGLPLLAYVISLFGRWPGLDVLAIHIAVFVSATFVLVVFSRYRRGQSRLHWVPRALIAFFVLLAVMNAGFLYVATHGLPAGLAGLILPGGEKAPVHTGFAGTTRHGQDAAKAIGADLSREHRNRLLGWHVRVEGLRAPRRGEQAVFVHVEDERGSAVSGAHGEMRLARPGGAGHSVRLTPTGAGSYEARLDFAGSGLWLLELRLGQGGKVYRQAWEVSVP
jgi:hypothetical protein